MGKEKELKAQNRLKALELASIVYPNKVVRAEELVNTLKKRAEELLDWAYEEEEKEFNPAENPFSILNALEKYYQRMEKKEKENNPFGEFGEDAELLNRWSKDLIGLNEVADMMIFKYHLNELKKENRNNNG